VRDGLYQVTTSYLCAGYILQGGVVTACAPVLKNKINYWKTIGVWVCDV